MPSPCAPRTWPRRWSTGASLLLLVGATWAQPAPRDAAAARSSERAAATATAAANRALRGANRSDVMVEQAMAAVAEAASAASAAATRIAALEREVALLRADPQSADVQRQATLDRQRDRDAALALALVGCAALGALAVRQALAVADLRRRLAAPTGAAPASTTTAPTVPAQGTAVARILAELASVSAAAARAVGRGSAAASGDAPPVLPGPRAARVGALALPPAATERRPPRPAAPPAAVDSAADDVTDVAHRTLVPPSPMQQTQPLPQVAGESAPRDVSIDELIDLEQQADFFVALGQDESAIDLLVGHLRATGGGSPLPYLKLLEIHRRRDDRDAYERLRSRFNQRFNAYAPQWGDDMDAGRSLEDYAGIVPRLQQVWPRPLDAMAELEALLFRKSRGDLFDLPAFRDVLFLYGLARDLLDRDSAAESVDVLLPLADGGDFSFTAPAPLLLDGAPITADEDRVTPATAALDVDLSLFDRPASIFEPPSDPKR